MGAAAPRDARPVVPRTPGRARAARSCAAASRAFGQQDLGPFPFLTARGRQAAAGAVDEAGQQAHAGGGAFWRDLAGRQDSGDGQRTLGAEPRGRVSGIGFHGCHPPLRGSFLPVLRWPRIRSRGHGQAGRRRLSPGAQLLPRHVLGIVRKFRAGRVTPRPRSAVFDIAGAPPFLSSALGLGGRGGPLLDRRFHRWNLLSGHGVSFLRSGAESQNYCRFGRRRMLSRTSLSSDGAFDLRGAR